MHYFYAKARYKNEHCEYKIYISKEFVQKKWVSVAA